jgi:hypothetical protein
MIDLRMQRMSARNLYYDWSLGADSAYVRA